MSYILPPNSKGSILLYLDSRDADIYLAQNSQGVDLFSYFQYILKENIEIPHNQRALISLHSATIPYSFYNIRTGINDTLIFKVDAGGQSTSTQTLTIPAGNYSVYSLQEIITTDINSHQSVGFLEYTFTMDYDTDKNKFLYGAINDLVEATPVVVSFFFVGNDQACNIEMGFNENDSIVITNTDDKSLRYSKNVVDINGSIHGVYIRSNLVSKGTLDSQNGTLSNILARIPLSVQSGGILFAEQNSHKSIVDIRTINTLTIRLTDERNRILDLNGLHFQLCISIDFIYAEKPILLPTGGLSENSGLSFHNNRELATRDNTKNSN
jgi:hypothetical protein